MIAAGEREPLRLGTSFRLRAPEDTVAIATPLLADHGIRRIVDVTRLDRIGLPVFVAVRPTGRVLCVHAGKGATPAESRASAVMEALEFAVAERLPARGSLLSLTAGQARREFGVDVLSFCPRLGVEIPSDEPLQWVLGTDLSSGEERPLPWDLVYLVPPTASARWFGSNTTGLASGNDVDEATLHALLEIVERDVKSLQTVRDETLLVLPDSLPESVGAVMHRIRAAGLQCRLRFAGSDHGLPWFRAVIWDPEEADPELVNAGYGCHVDAETAALRAVLEAVQSRLVYIHGGRDDLAEVFLRHEQLGSEGRAQHVQELLARAGDASRCIRFEEVASWATAGSLDAALAGVLDALQRSGLGPAIRYVYESPNPRLSFVRVSVAGAENFTLAERKVGRRLVAHLRSQGDALGVDR